MRRKIKIIFAIMLTIYITVGIHGYMSQVKPDEPPNTAQLEILIDLKTPTEGAIHVTYPEEEVGTNDFSVFTHANFDAGRILNQYYISAVENPLDVKPVREDGKVTVPLDFFAKNEYEFVWPVCTFNSTWVQMWQVADFTVILPEGYEIVDITTENVVKKPKRRFVDDRWEIETKTLENSEFQIEITYKKEE